MDKEMIERIIKASFDCWNERRGLNYTVDDLSDSEREFAELHALAIVKAMREPTEKMIKAGQYIDTVNLEKDIWQAMIDAVINDRY